MKKVIIVTGPECSGKTTLSLELSQHIQADYHAEYAVEYLKAIDRQYTLEDLITITREQGLKRVQSKNDKIVQIYDTSSLVLSIWADEKFNQVPKEISDSVDRENADLYLLCYPDLEWEQDEAAQRENPHDRERLFVRYLNMLKDLNLPFAIIKGENRLEQALAAIAQ